MHQVDNTITRFDIYLYYKITTTMENQNNEIIVSKEEFIKFLEEQKEDGIDTLNLRSISVKDVIQNDNHEYYNNRTFFEKEITIEKPNVNYITKEDVKNVLQSNLNEELLSKLKLWKYLGHTNLKRESDRKGNTIISTLKKETDTNVTKDKDSIIHFELQQLNNNIVTLTSKLEEIIININKPKENWLKKLLRNLKILK